MTAVVVTQGGAAAIKVIEISARPTVPDLVDEFDVREGKVSRSALQLALPLSVDVHLGHCDYVAHLQLQCRLIVRIRHSRLLNARQRR